MGYTNYDIIPAALAGKNRATTTGHFSTDAVEGYTRYVGRLPKKLRAILDSRQGHVTQVIYSYATPIAWLDGDTWIIPDVRYSATTSTKHQSKLYKLPNKQYIPWDESLEVYERILAGFLTYSPGYNRQTGSYAKAA